MTKTKAQLRAEAVERLERLERSGESYFPSDVLHCVTPPEEAGIDTLIDLLTDDEPQDVTTPEFDVPLYGWHEGDTREKLEEDSLQDSRERLEEDVRGYYDEHECDTLMRVDFFDAVYAWLDRQAAITRAECDKPNWDYCETCEQLKTMQDKIAELKADNDCLRDCNEKLDYEVRDWKGEAKTQRNNFEQATQARKHWQKKYEYLKATSYSANAPSDESELARELGNALAERDMYREKLGRAVDAAHEVVRMMEVE